MARPPGKGSPARSGRWAAFWDRFDECPIGEWVTKEFSNKKKARQFRSTVSSTLSLRRKKNRLSYSYRSEIRGNIVSVQKLALQGKERS